MKRSTKIIIAAGAAIWISGVITIAVQDGLRAAAKPYVAPVAETTPQKTVAAAKTNEWGIVKLSTQCAREIMSNRATPRCEEEGQRWNESVKRATKNPAFVRKLSEFYPD